jgi:hypothetical protein
MNALAREPTPPLKTKYNGQGEAEVVPGFQLSPTLRRWVTRYLAERPLNTYSSGSSYGTQVEFLGPIQYLSENTGIHLRRVSAICNGEIEFVPLSQADLLLTAIDMHLSNPEIQVVPNPNWSLERWLAYRQDLGSC